jgi:hypothetical protein
VLNELPELAQRSRRPAAEVSRSVDRPCTSRRAAGHPLLDLQRVAGNRAVSRAVAGAQVVQRERLFVHGGGEVTDRNGPGTNERAVVRQVQQRLVAIGALSETDAAVDRARMELQHGRIMAADITNTTAAITRASAASLSEPAAKKVLKVDLVAGVGVGEGNDAADLELVLNLLREEQHVTNIDFNAASVVLSGAGRTVDPASLPGFLAGLTKLKRGYLGGYPFRGTTRGRKHLLAAEGTAAYQKAIEDNLAGRRAMQKWLDEAAGQDKDIVLRNSAQWCKSGRTKLYCQTRTHDSAARVKAAAQPKRFYAIFGYPLGALTEAQVPYLRKRRGDAAFDNTNVAIEAPSGGSAPAGAITVVDPVSAGRRHFMDTLRHEVQHTADHHPATDVGLYKTEFNARWIEARFAAYSARKLVVRQGHTWNERQYAIFRNLWEYPDLYPYVRRNWTSAVAADRTAWRAMVVGLTRPETFNPINSVRIEALSEAISRCTTADCLADDKYRAGKAPRNAAAFAVREAMTALDPVDRAAIRDNTELNAKAALNLAGKIRDEYLALR